MVANTNKPSSDNLIHRIKGFPASKWDGLSEEQWNAVPSATTFDSVVIRTSWGRYAIERQYIAGSPVCNFVKSNLSGNSFCLSLQAADDTIWTAQSGTVHNLDIERGQDHIDQGIKLTISYHIPNVTVVVKNNYVGGLLYVDDTLYSNVGPQGVSK